MDKIGPVRIVTGQAAAVRESGQGAEGEVHTEPADTLSLGVQSQDLGSGLLSSRFKVRVEDRDGRPDLKVSIGQRWGRGYAIISNGDGETQVKVPIGAVAGWAVESYFTPGGGPKSELYLSYLQEEGVKAIEIEKDGPDGRITFHRSDGGSHGIGVGGSLNVWRA